MSIRRQATVLYVAALLACSVETRQEILAPQMDASDPASGPWAGGHANVIQQPSGALRTFSFHARVMPDGSVQGEYDNHNRQGGMVNHGDIDCMKLVGTNGAVLSGIVRKHTNPTFEGQRTVFSVEDNGEGGSDETPDAVSQVTIFPATPLVDCQAFTPPSLLPIVGGNVQVRP